MPGRGSVRRALGRLGLLVIATAGALLAAEGFARRGPDVLAVPASMAAGMDPRTSSCAELSSTRGYRIVGRCGRDADGFLTPEGRGDPDALRILLVGDSVGAQDWTKDLARELERRLGRAVELLNASVPGYGTCQEAAALREGIAAGHPHVALLQTCANDTAITPVVLADGDFWLRVHLPTGWRRVPRLLADSVIVQRLLFTPAWSQAPRPEPLAAAAAAGTCAEEAVVTARRAGVPLLVLHFPVMADPGEDLPGPTGSGVADHFASAAVVRAYWAAAGSDAVDLRDPFAQLGPWATLRFSPSDSLHLNPARGAEVGTRLAPIVLDRLALDPG